MRSTKRAALTLLLINILGAVDNGLETRRTVLLVLSVLILILEWRLFKENKKQEEKKNGTDATRT